MYVMCTHIKIDGKKKLEISQHSFFFFHFFGKVTEDEKAIMKKNNVQNMCDMIWNHKHSKLEFNFEKKKKGTEIAPEVSLNYVVLMQSHSYHFLFCWWMKRQPKWYMMVWAVCVCCSFDSFGKFDFTLFFFFFYLRLWFPMNLDVTLHLYVAKLFFFSFRILIPSKWK